MNTEKIELQAGNFITIDADPSVLQDYVIAIRARMKILEEEARLYDDAMMALVKAKNGKISSDFGEFKGEVTLCAKKKYKFSVEVQDLEQQAKYLDTKIKAKKMVEIASGAEVDSVDEYLRYNIKMKKED